MHLSLISLVLPETDGSPSLIETMSYREYTEPTSREITLPSTKEITIPSSTENIHLTTPSTIEKVLSHNTEETLSTDTTISQSTLNFEKVDFIDMFMSLHACHLTTQYNSALLIILHEMCV